MNFSPVIVHEGWEPEWRGRFAAIDDTLSDRAKAQLKCEIIMLTHNAGLHGTNLAWQPKGEDLLWPRTSKKRRFARDEGGSSGVPRLPTRTAPPRTR